jgi:hypothetical protein
MKTWGIGLMSNEEKRSILDQHKSLYDGYRTMLPQVSNTQPLYVQDFANDKGGITVNNKFNVKPYTNMGINESLEKESMCSECGGMVYEGECSECGWKGDMGEETQQVKNLRKVEDLNLSDKFDYTEEEMDEEEEITTDPNKETETQDPHQVGPSTDDGFGDYQDGDVYETQQGNPYDNEESAYDFVSGGPLQEYDPMESAWSDENEGFEEVTNDFGKMSQDDEFEDDFGKMSQDDEFEDDFGKMSQDDEFEDDFEKMSTDDEFEDNFDSTLLDGLEDEEYDADIDILDEIEDEDLKESVILQKNKINEMFNRMKRF